MPSLWGDVDSTEVVEKKPRKKKPKSTQVRSLSCITTVALGEVGVREKGGNNKGKRIGQYLKVTNLPEGYAWCAAYVCWVMEECGAEHPASAWSPTVAFYNPVYRKGDEFPNWEHGLVFGLYYDRLGRVGHVGIIKDVKGNKVYTIEGNTSRGQVREGDGVHELIRPKKSIYVISKYGKAKVNNSVSYSSGSTYNSNWTVQETRSSSPAKPRNI